MCRGSIALFLFPFLVPGHALAHDRTLSWSDWEIDGAAAEVDVGVPAASLDFALDTAARELAVAELPNQLRLSAGGEPCSPLSKPEWMGTTGDVARVRWTLVCPSEESLAITSGLLANVPGHAHVATVRRPGEPPIENVLAAEHGTWIVPDADEPVEAGASLRGPILLGIEHILTGWDHLVFLLALLLPGSAFGTVVRVVTGFTVGHSVTLGLAATGVLRPDSGAVEALIGLSIVLVAVENVWLRGSRGWTLPALAVASLAALAAASPPSVPPRTLLGLAVFTAATYGLLLRSSRPEAWRWALAGLFGLLHGFGFAGVLLDVGLPADRALTVLFGFNVGVELGQLAVVAAAWPLVRRWARPVGFGRWFPDWASAAVAGVGTFWFVTRAW